MKYLIFFVLGFAALFGLALRSVEVFNHNYVFVYDQGLDMLAARSIAVDHKLTLIGSEAGGGFAGLPGIFHGPGYHYLLAGIIWISSGDSYGAMVALLVMQIVSIVFLYAIGNRLFGRWGAVASAFVVIVSPAFIGMSRVIWAPNFSVLFILIYLYILLVRKHNSIREIFFLGLSGSLLYHFEIPFAVAACISAAMVLLFVDKKKTIWSWFSLCMGFAIGFFPMIAFDARHGWLAASGVVRFLFNPVHVTQSAPFDIIGHIHVLFYHANGIFPPISGLPNWFWFVLMAACAGLFRNIPKGLLILFLTHVFLFLPYRNPIYGHYLTILSYVYVLTAGYIAATLIKKRLWMPILLITVLLVFPACLLYSKTIVADYQDYGGTAKIRGKTDAIDFIYHDAKGLPFGLFIFSPPVYTYPYDYILQWYAKPKYGYLPSSTKDSVFYLLMEKDGEKPWSYQGWMETVIKTGTVEFTKTLPSGFIIQKRHK